MAEAGELAGRDLDVSAGVAGAAVDLELHSGRALCDRPTSTSSGRPDRVHDPPLQQRVERFLGDRRQDEAELFIAESQ